MKWVDYSLLLVLLLCGQGPHAAENVPVVAVAANFSKTLDRIITEFSATTGKPIRITSGATGTLVTQIEQGAPFELFLSADSEHVDYLHRKGLTRDGGRIYAIGILVLYLPQTTRLNFMAENADILKQLFSRNSLRLAIANPDLAPYGLAARQVLQRFGQWHMIQDRVVLGENVGQAAQFALSGSVDAALLPYALTLDHVMQESGHFQLIPPDWYTPIRQRMVLLNRAGPTAAALYEYISGVTAQKIIGASGYGLPSP